jgi:hypothetical protein
MLTSFQVATGAYQDENGDFLCEECFEKGDTYARPISNFELDEEQSHAAEGWRDWNYGDEQVEVSGETYTLGRDDQWHVEACGCEPPLLDLYGHEIREAYRDTYCLDERPEADDEKGD